MPSEIFRKNQKEGQVSEVQGDVSRATGGIAPSGKKIFERTTLEGNEKVSDNFDPLKSHKVSEVKEPFGPSGKKVTEGTKLEGEDKERDY